MLQYRLSFISLAFLHMMYSTGVSARDAVTVDVYKDGSAFSAKGTGIINAPIDIVWEVINDFNGHGKFMPNARKSRIVGKRGKGILVYKVVDLALKRVSYTLLVYQYKEKYLTSYRSIEGPFKKNNGTWKLYDLGDGRTRLEYGMEVVPDFYVPSWLQKIMYKETFPGFFRAVGKEARKRLKGR